MSTTAVSFRKGNTEENNSFAGVAGEIVADLGANSQDTSNATIVLHTGNGAAGGIRMAREDLNNITTESINNLASFEQVADSGGTYYGLARRNLSNYVNNNVNAEVIEPRLKADYKIASQNARDINTTELTGPDGDQGDNDAPGGGLKLATRTLSNLHNSGKTVVKQLSYTYWLSMVDTAHLAEDNGTVYPAGSGDIYHRPTGPNQPNKKLAYADMSNVNTEDLATTGAGHSGKNLAYWDLRNVGYNTIVNYLDEAYTIGDVKLQKYEWVANKTNTIDRFASNIETVYPTVSAVVTYNTLIGQNYTNTKLNNILSWQIASEKKDLNKIEFTIDDGGSGYATNSIITTNVAHPDGGWVQIQVDNVDTDGKILEASIYTPIGSLRDKLYASTAITSSIYTETTGGAIFTIYSTGVVAGKLMRDDLSNSDITNTAGTHAGSIKYGFTETTQGSGVINSVDSVVGQLSDTTTNTAGSFSVDRETSGVEAKISASDTTSGSEKYSSVTVVKNNAYLNKNEIAEVFDTNHEMLNRGEINSAIQDAMEAAISTAVVFKGIVADETYLPSTAGSISASQTSGGSSLGTVSVVRSTFETQITVSGDYVFTFDGTNWKDEINNTITLSDYGISYTGTEVQNDAITVVYRESASQAPTNGDLYWVTTFSSNPPAGMISGRSGSAIWNANITPAAWSYKMDNQNTPDNQTLEYSGSSTQQVLKVKLAGAHNSKPNALVVESDGLYVKTPVETPELPTLPNAGDTGVYHLYAQNVGGTMQYSWVNDALLAVTQNS